MERRQFRNRSKPEITEAAAIVTAHSATAVLDPTAALARALAELEASKAREAVLIAKNEKLETENAAQKAEIIELRVQAWFDQLTGLTNRRHGQVIALDMIASASAQERKLGVVMFDFDNFKAVNDILGHEAGDAALKIAAEIARKYMRFYTMERTEPHAFRDNPEVHHAIRQGGDEHIFLIDNPQDEKAIIKISDRMRTEIAEGFKDLSQQMARILLTPNEELLPHERISDEVREKYVGKIPADIREKMLNPEMRGRLLSQDTSLSDAVHEDYLKHLPRASASFGVTLFHPDAELKGINALHHETVHKPGEYILKLLLRMVDKALYESKGRGRNCVTAADDLEPKERANLANAVRSLPPPDTSSEPAPRTPYDGPEFIGFPAPRAT